MPSWERIILFPIRAVPAVSDASPDSIPRLPPIGRTVETNKDFEQPTATPKMLWTRQRLARLRRGLYSRYETPKPFLPSFLPLPLGSRKEPI